MFNKFIIQPLFLDTISYTMNVIMHIWPLLWERNNLSWCWTSVTFMWPCIVINFLIIKPTRCTNFSNLFWNETPRVSDSSSVHHQEFIAVHTAMVNVIQVCWQLASWFYYYRKWRWTLQTYSKFESDILLKADKTTKCQWHQIMGTRCQILQPL
jgi:hypothetical protein